LSNFVLVDNFDTSVRLASLVANSIVRDVSFFGCVVVFSLALLLVVGIGRTRSGGRRDRGETVFSDEVFSPGVERFVGFGVRVLGDSRRVGFGSFTSRSVKLTLLFDVDSPAIDKKVNTRFEECERE